MWVGVDRAAWAALEPDHRQRAELAEEIGTAPTMPCAGGGFLFALIVHLQKNRLSPFSSNTLILLVGGTGIEPVTLAV